MRRNICQFSLCLQRSSASRTVTPAVFLRSSYVMRNGSASVMGTDLRHVDSYVANMLGFCFFFYHSNAKCSDFREST